MDLRGDELGIGDHAFGPLQRARQVALEKAHALGRMGLRIVECGKVMHRGHGRPVERHQDVVRRVQKVTVQLSRMRAEQHVAYLRVGLECARLERQVLAQAGEQAVRAQRVGRVVDPAHGGIQAQLLDRLVLRQALRQFERIATDAGQRRADRIDIENDAH